MFVMSRIFVHKSQTISLSLMRLNFWPWQKQLFWQMTTWRRDHNIYENTPGAHFTWQVKTVRHAKGPHYWKNKNSLLGQGNKVKYNNIYTFQMTWSGLDSSIWNVSELRDSTLKKKPHAQDILNKLFPLK